MLNILSPGESANHNKSMFLNKSVSITPINTHMRNVTYSGRGRGSYGGRGGGARHSTSQPCLVCDEQVRLFFKNIISEILVPNSILSICTKFSFLYL